MSRALVLLAPLLLLPGEDVPLIRGADIAQFELVGLTPEAIAIVDGEVRLAGKPLGYFATRARYKDYVLTFEYRYDRPEGLAADVDVRGNSGVLLHASGPAKVWPACVQVQLAQADAGAIFAMGDARCDLVAVADPPAQKAAIKAVGEWNRVQVTCRAGAITSVLNGVEVARAEKAEPDHGAIGWQSEGKPVRFREIRIGPLP